MSELKHSRRFTPMQYIVAVATLLLSVTAISYAAVTFSTFSTGPISAQQVNDNFTNIKETLASLDAAIKSNEAASKSYQVPAGTLITYAGTTIPTGYIQCPTTQLEANVSRASYPALFTAIGTSWGIPLNGTTFVMPWFPEGYALLQANAVSPNVGTQSVGQVITHTHPLAPASNGAGGGADAGQRLMGNGGTSFVTGSTGGTANLAAGTKVMILVKL